MGQLLGIALTDICNDLRLVGGVENAKSPQYPEQPSFHRTSTHHSKFPVNTNTICTSLSPKLDSSLHTKYKMIPVFYTLCFPGMQMLGKWKKVVLHYTEIAFTSTPSGFPKPAIRFILVFSCCITNYHQLQTICFFFFF